MAPRVRARPLTPGASLLASLTLAALAAGACGDGGSPASSLTASPRLTGTRVQYLTGAFLDDPAAQGPAVHAISAVFHVTPGAVGRSVSGSAEKGTSAVLVGLD